jgi:hypothetical protein
VNGFISIVSSTKAVRDPAMTAIAFRLVATNHKVLSTHPIFKNEQLGIKFFSEVNFCKRRTDLEM